ncbi:D-glycero-beta-D-manno-heptose 1-phosphate adenylyltransferase [Leptospira sp. GIMC2001]|uniref:D-glycero-beta-D-manno-heptose 1-phosphate adenylyltransferase n=1 Tax=Leptospira sp. GIMC2001 TaxID=1513297 RepID=UPI002349C667|nr:D-glycero-beta-D-manno-heptose 1-phosphate adenylyltransferase [Leptospira sp. GIMC2001]WCL47905.1 D-glycero-beta-D-manno-heptose 1-phosphate adenylyltransferase [Leptospira sp. GIMC2001]
MNELPITEGISSLNKKIIAWNQIEETKEDLANKKIVFTNGCFDIIHRGHVEYLNRAKNLGDVLWLGLNSDASVSKLKGSNRPINEQFDRAIVLAGLSCIDFITIFPEETPIELLKKIKPDIHTKGGDYNPETLPETQIVRSFGGIVKILPFVEGKSTTNTLKKLERTLGH